MTFSLTSPLTGLAQTGFTTPAYTLTQDGNPDFNAKQWAVTGLTGTQVGVTTHSVSSPFTLAMFRPKKFQSLGKPNPTTGLIPNVPYNTYKVITRKGVLPLAGQPLKNMIITTIIEIPAGADTADAPNVRAAESAHFGVVSQVSSGIGDTTVSGIL